MDNQGMAILEDGDFANGELIIVGIDGIQQTHAEQRGGKRERTEHGKTFPDGGELARYYVRFRLRCVTGR